MTYTAYFNHWSPGDEQSPEMGRRPDRYDLPRGPQPRLEIVPTESPAQRDRRERDEAVIRDGALDHLRRGGRLDKPKPPIYH